MFKSGSCRKIQISLTEKNKRNRAKYRDLLLLEFGRGEEVAELAGGDAAAIGKRADQPSDYSKSSQDNLK